MIYVPLKIIEIKIHSEFEHSYNLIDFADIDIINTGCFSYKEKKVNPTFKHNNMDTKLICRIPSYDIGS